MKLVNQDNIKEIDVENSRKALRSKKKKYISVKYQKGARRKEIATGHMFYISHLQLFSRVNLCNLVVRNQEKKPGELEKTRLHKRIYNQKLVTTIKLEKEEFYLAKVCKRIKDGKY